MKHSYRFLFPVVFGLLSPSVAWSQELLNITGHVINDDEEPMPGATVLVSGTFVGSATNGTGDFLISVENAVFPLTLSVSYQGYETEKVTVSQAGELPTVTLTPARAQINQIVVAASRQEENILRVPVTVEKVDQTQIRQFTRPDLLSNLARFKGIDVSASGMLNNSISTRGFNSATSERLVQLVDYMDIQAPTISSGMGNLLGIPEIDVASVEVLYGPSSALYGANAFNGVVLLNSRDAFTDQGLDVRLRGGQRQYGDGQLRYAQRLGRRWAFKVTGSYATAREWTPENYSAQSLSQLTTVNNPTGSGLGYDAVNRYGDLGQTFSGDPNDPTYGGALAGRTVFMPGWTERELLADDNRTYQFRVMPSLSYLITDKVKITGDFKRAQGNTILESANRFRAKNFGTNQFRLALDGGKWFVRAFQTEDFTKDSYDLGYLGSFLQLSSNPATEKPYRNDYFAAYKDAYNAAYSTNGGDDDAAQVAAQAAAAPFQLAAGTPEFNNRRWTIVGDSRSGARIDASSQLRDVSAQYNFQLPFADLIVGGAYRELLLDRSGTIFDSNEGRGHRNYEYGGYAQVTKTLLDERLKLAAAGRLDDFKNFDRAFSPRASAVYSLGEERQHNFRASYSRAFRSPAQYDQYASIDVGTAVVRGNVGNGFRGYNLALASQLLNISTSNDPEAELAAYAVDLSPLRLEQVDSYEAGYKGVVAKDLVLDLSYYRSYYHDFVQNQPIIGNVDGSRPSFEQVAVGAASGFQDPQQPTRVLLFQDNLKSLVRTHGALASVTYTVLRELNLTGNYSLNVLLNSADEISFYNTPKHKFNVGAYGELTRQLGYNVNYRWAQSHRYESTFAAGTLQAYHSLDGQLRYILPKLGTSLEIGGSNLLNTNNVQTYGGPQIGRLIYAGVSLSVK